MDYFITALAGLLNPSTVLAVFIGTLIGVVVGALPGLGSVIGITLCLPFTYAMADVPAISLLLGVYAGSVYGGCIAAILINTPGTPASAATAFDGFPMARKGQADIALGWATMASVLGGIFSCLVLLFAAPQLAALAMRFGPVETFALILMGLTCISTVSQGSQIKGLFSGLCGLMFAVIGQDPMSGDLRFTFGFFALAGGVDLIAVLVGIFALSEVLTRVDIIAREKITNIISCPGMKFPTWAEWKPRLWIFLKSSVMGTFIGVLPGTGSSTAAFISYGEAKRSSPRRHLMGQGEPDGVLAPEAANNAVTGGALVPALALGIPGDAVTAVMLATLLIHGVTPGVRLMVDSPVIVYSIFLVLVVANLLLIPMGIWVTRGFTYLLKLPESLLLPLITILCLLGSFCVRNSLSDLVVTVLTGFVGVLFRYFSVPLAPLVIGLVLGNLFEISLRQAVIFKRGELYRFFTEHPIALFLFIATALMLFGPHIHKYRSKRKQALAQTQ